MKRFYLSKLIIPIAIFLGMSLSAGAQTIFSTAGGPYTYTVPAGVTTLGVDIAGAQGGTYSSVAGGLGGRVTCNLTVVPLSVLQIYVGGTTTSTTGGLNGGANGSNGGGGGGGSDIRTTAGLLSSRVVVGGGGGGSTYYCYQVSGGTGGYPNGGNGVPDGCWGTCYAGNGASTLAGGAGAACGCGSTGSVGIGGAGGCGYAGGGGGGYYGGGGGYYGPGGGGSSWAGPSCTGVQYFNGTQSSDGFVKIYGPSLTASPTPLSFGPVTAGTTSVPAKFFTMSGTYMGAGPLSITAPAGFRLSLDGITWTTPISPVLTYPFVGSTIGGTSAQIYVKFDAPATIGTYCGNISISGGGLATPTLVNVCGNSVNACTGTPAGGLSQVTPSGGGTLTAFNLSLSPAPTAGGLTYQWQSSPTGTSGTWTSIPGAVTASYNFTGISANTYYQCLVTCPAGGSTTTFAAALATYMPVAGSSCTPTCANSASIGSFCGFGFYCGTTGQPVTINGAGGTVLSDPTSCGTAVYLDQTATSYTCTMAPGGSYTSTIGAATTNIISVQVWIDFNNNGIFDPSESVGGIANAPSGARPSPGLTIPSTVLPGIYRLRMITAFSSGNAPGNANYPAYSSMPPCPTTTVQYAETRDYKVTIGNGPCSGTPYAGISDASVLAACAPNPLNSNLYDIGSTQGTGITYQWMQSPTGTGYGPIGGATNAVYTPTVTTVGSMYYVCRVTCAISGLASNTNPQVLTLNPPPTPLTGTPTICTGLNQTYVSTPSGGVWTSSNPALASVGSGTGIASGIAAGTPTITYTLPVTGCYATLPITVNANPTAILPPSIVVCKGQTIGLSSTPSGGTWTGLPPTVGTVTSLAGVLTGVNAGTGNVSYTLPTGCFVSSSFTVNALPGLFILTAPFGTSYCAGSPSTVEIRLSGSTAGIYYQLLLGGAPAGTPLPGTGGVLSFGIQSAPGTYTCVATNAATLCQSNMISSVTVVINPLPVVCNVYGGGSYCPGNPAPNVYIGCSQFGVNYKLYNPGIVGVFPGAGGSINFGPQTTAGTYTVVAQNATTGCINNMTGSATININPLPSVFNVTGGGAYCIGGTGIDVGLNFSNTGITYSLYNGSSFIGSLTGTGAPLDFGLQSMTGLYTITALNTSTGCTNTMAGSALVDTSSLPVVYDVAGGGSYCAGGAGAEVTLTPSQPGVNYQLYLGSTPVGTAVAGTGLGISLGFHTVAGTYTVVAVNATTGCTSNMNGSAIITINTLPIVFNVTGGGNFCVGGTGVHVGLSSSTSGISYQLMRGGVATGLPMTGTGSALDFGLMTVSGIYTVVATDLASGCTVVMNGIATVGVNPLPTPFNVTGTGAYCTGGTGVDVGLDFSATGISYQLYRGGILIGSAVSGTGAPLDFGMQTVAAAYTVVGTNTTSLCTNNMAGSAIISVNPLPVLHLVTGGGAYCAGGLGVDIGLNASDPGISYQLFLGFTPVGGPLTGTGGALDFGNQTNAGAYTVIATNIATGCTKVMLGVANVVVNPAPVAYTVIGGGIYCAGGTGAHIGLSGSTSGIRYQLKIGGVSVGSPLVGTGSALDFGLQITAGTYTVLATNTTTGCTNMMTGSSVIATNPLPTVFAVTGGGAYCVGDAGYSVGLSGSAPSINYQLLLAGAPVGAPLSGTGLALDFGIQTTPGTYTVVATDVTTGCSDNMTGSAIIIINSLPAAYTVSGGGNYCAGGAGLHVFQNLSATGISYQMYLGSVAVGVPMTGTGAALDFGAQTASGTYTVIATNTATGCVNNMSGSAVIGVNPLPAVHNITGGGGYCPGATGVHIGVDGTDPGIKYQLNFGTSGMGLPMSGTGSSIDFGLYVPAGNYTVVATDVLTGCTSNMNGSAVVSVNPTPAVYSVTGGGNYCATGLGMLVGLSGSEVATSYQLYQYTSPSGIALPGTGGTVDFGRKTAVGTYTVKATNNITGCTSNMSGSAIINVLPVLLPHVSVTPSIAGTVCVGQSVHFSATPINGGTAPTYQWMVNGSSAGVGTAFSYTPSNGDVVTATIHSNATCAIPDTGSSSVVMDVSVMQMPSATVAINPGTEVCTGSPATFTATTMFGGPTPELLWIKNGLFVSAGSTYTYTPSNGDIITFMLGSSFNCRLADTVFSTPDVINVSAGILPTVAVTANPGASLGNGTPVTFTATVTHGTAAAYQWVVNSHAIAGATLSTFTSGTIANNDSVTCEVTGTCGLVGFNSIVMHVSSVGVKPVTTGNSDVRLVPNPNKGEFSVRGTFGSSVDQEVTIEVTDMLGQVIYNGKAATHNGNIDEHIRLSNTLANGMYILNLRSGSENSIFHFVIEQ
jgi:Glycine rich protein/GEVED domain/Secretion system C-terminal sorting domain